MSETIPPLGTDFYTSGGVQVVHDSEGGSSYQNASNLNTGHTLLRVLFVVQSGSDHRLSQIIVNGLSTRSFFIVLRSDYFKLLGLWRSLLSIWRFSHCEFYRVSLTRPSRQYQRQI